MTHLLPQVPLHVVAVHERVSVDSSQQHARSRELQRSWFRVRWLE